MVSLIGNWALGLGAFGVVLEGCSGHTASHQTQPSAGAAGTSTSEGGTKPDTTPAGSGNGGASATGGSADAGATSGGVPSVGGSNAGGAGAGGSNAGGSNAGVSNAGGGQAGMAGASGGGAGGSGVLDPTAILKVKPSPGCGKDATQATGVLVKYTIQTSGTKDVNCADHLNGIPKCGDWSIPRDYYLWLPPGYSKTQPYPLVLEGPGCGGTGAGIYSLSPTNTDVGVGVDGTVIRVGLTPPPNSIGHGTNENQGCFDDKEGDDSVDIVFYETLIDQLKTELCYDENRVFVAGNSSGAWLANELACKYAGATDGYAIRGVVVNQGGLPTDPKFVPTCSGKPLAGLWVNEVGDITDTFSGNRVAINRAMTVNNCVGTSVESATLQDFPIGAGNASSTCKRILGCPDAYPLVLCALPGNGHGGHEDVFNPAFAAFEQQLAAP